jgi:hypothetical protein
MNVQGPCEPACTQSHVVGVVEDLVHQVRFEVTRAHRRPTGAVRQRGLAQHPPGTEAPQYHRSWALTLGARLRKLVVRGVLTFTVFRP